MKPDKFLNSAFEVFKTTALKPETADNYLKFPSVGYLLLIFFKEVQQTVI